MKAFKSAVTATLFAAFSFGGAHVGHAAIIVAGPAYAVSALDLRDLVVATSGATFTFGATTTLSFADATKRNLGVSMLDATDAPPANSPGNAPVRANNVFSRFGLGAGDYATADAAILSQQALGAPSSAASDIAEINLTTPGAASASAGNRSDTAFTVAGTGGVMSFTFEADPFQEIVLGMGASASATSLLRVSITNGSGGIVFSWSPNGAASAAGTDTGVDEILDSEDLNHMLAGNGTFSPTNAFLPYSAATSAGVLSPGAYMLTFEMPEIVQASVVPEPGTIALVGLGFLGLLRRSTTVKG